MQSSWLEVNGFGLLESFLQILVLEVVKVCHLSTILLVRVLTIIEVNRATILSSRE